MLNFLPLQEKDREAVKKKMGNNSSKICELCPADFFYWGLNGDAKIALDGDDLYILWTYEGEYGYAYPYARDEDAALDKVLEHAKAVGHEASIIDMTKEQAKRAEEKFQKKAEWDRDWCDYLYSAKDLVDLAGKKYHGQKNHLNKFKKTYPQAIFTPYTAELQSAALRFFEKYYATEKPSGLLFEGEKEVFWTRLHRPDPTEKSGVYLVDGEIVAVTFGEVLDDTLFVHTEKALRAYEGSYAAINNAFVTACVKDNPNILYVNREEDLGEEGLRKAKTELHPIRLLEKYYLRLV